MLLIIHVLTSAGVGGESMLDTSTPKAVQNSKSWSGQIFPRGEPAQIINLQRKRISGVISTRSTQNFRKNSFVTFCHDFYSILEVHMNSRLNWRAARSNIAQMPCGIMFEDFDANLG